MNVSEYEALPNLSTGLTAEGQQFVPDSLMASNLNTALKQSHESHEAGDEVTILEVSRMVDGVIINFNLVNKTLE